MKTNQATLAVEETIDWGSIEGENSDFAVQYPRLQWSHGEAKASGWMKSGGLFIPSEQYPNFTGEGFEPTTLVTDDGTNIDGFAAVNAKLAVIRVKHQWVKDEKYNRNVPLVHALIFVKGCEDLLCLSLRGATKALEFQKAFNQHIAQNVSVANRTRPQGAQSIEPFALWFPIHAGESRKVSGKDSDKSSSVTPPELIAPAVIDRAYVTTLWVGTDNYKLFASYWKETKKWQGTPIWEQRDAVPELPEFSGGESDNNYPRIDKGVLGQLLTLATMKGVDEKELCLSFTHGETDRFDNLTPTEGAELIANLKSI